MSYIAKALHKLPSIAYTVIIPPAHVLENQEILSTDVLENPGSTVLSVAATICMSYTLCVGDRLAALAMMMHSDNALQNSYPADLGIDRGVSPAAP